MIMTYYHINTTPYSIESITATTASIPNIMRPSTGCVEKGSCQTDKIWQDIASQVQERTKQHEQPDSPIKVRPLPEEPRPDYQEQCEVKMTK